MIEREGREGEEGGRDEKEEKKYMIVMKNQTITKSKHTHKYTYSILTNT